LPLMLRTDMAPTDASTTARPAFHGPGRPRDRWRTVRTITVELQALTRHVRAPRYDRPLATPEVLVDLPSFQGHMLHAGAVLPVPAVPMVREPVRTAAPAPRVQPRRESMALPLVLFGITGFLLGWIVFLASS